MSAYLISHDIWVMLIWTMHLTVLKSYRRQSLCKSLKEILISVRLNKDYIYKYLCKCLQQGDPTSNQIINTVQRACMQSVWRFDHALFLICLLLVAKRQKTQEVESVSQSPGSKAGSWPPSAGSRGCRSVSWCPSRPQAGSGVVKEAGPLLADDNESALRKERSLFCLHVQYTDTGRDAHVKAIQY